MRKIRVKILEDNHYTIRRLLSKGINIYNIEYTTNGNIYLINECDLENIPFEVSVISYNGLRGILDELRLHKHFIVNIIISICIMFVLSHMIFDIEVIHTDKNIRNMILEELTLNDVHPLMFKKSFDEKEKIKNIIKANHKDEIEWLEIIDNGMKYTIRVEERIKVSKNKDPVYCDVVSKKDALVMDGTVIKGQKIVLENDYVKKDSVLISGAIKFNEDTKNYVCASGTIYGNTWYTVNVSIPYEYEKRDYTGKVHINYSYEIGSTKTKIFKTHFANYETESKELLTLGNLIFYKDIEKEYKGKKYKYSDKEIKELGINTARKKLLTNLDNDSSIIYEKVLHSKSFDSIIEMELFYSVKEPIGLVLEREIPKEGE